MIGRDLSGFFGAIGLTLAACGLVTLSVGRAGASDASSGDRRVLTARDAVETADFVSSGGGVDQRIAYSPDGARYVVRVKRGDLKGNGFWIDVISGGLDSIDHAIHPKAVARLFSTGHGLNQAGGPAEDTSGSTSPVVWLDNRRIAFVHSDEKETRQVVEVDLVAKSIKYLTHHDSQVMEFAISSCGDIAFLARKAFANTSLRADAKSGSVVPEGEDLFAIINGHTDGTNSYDEAWSSEWYLQRPDKGPERLALGGLAVDRG